MLFSKKFFINQIFWSLLAQKSSNRFQTSERTPGGVPPVNEQGQILTEKCGNYSHNLFEKNPNKNVSLYNLLPSAAM